MTIPKKKFSFGHKYIYILFHFQFGTKSFVVIAIVVKFPIVCQCFIYTKNVEWKNRVYLMLGFDNTKKNKSFKKL